MDKYFAASDGARIHYVDMGAGPALFYMHAFGEDMAAKLPFFELLARHYRVVSFDQRGWGETPAAGEPGLERSAGDALELLEYLGLEDVYFVGYSMGVAGFFAYVRRFGTRHIRRAAVIDMSPCLLSGEDWAHGLYQGHYTRAQYEKDLETMERNYKEFGIYFVTEAVLPNQAANARDFSATEEKYDALKVMLKDMPGGAEAFIELPQEAQAVHRAYWISMCEEDFRPMLGQIDRPLAVIYARPGSLYDEATARYIAAQVHGASLYPIDQATHLVAMTHAADVLGILLAFDGRQAGCAEA